MTDVYIALGSNLDNRLNYLKKAVDLLNSLGNIPVTGGLYESSAYGFTDQPSFLNSALLLKTELKPIDLLNRLKEIEIKVGRKKRIHWGPREIDLDIVFYDKKTLQFKELIIPHPDFQNRRFVLQPLADISPDFVPPAHSESVSELLNNCNDNTKIELIAMEWYPNGIKI